MIRREDPAAKKIDEKCKGELRKMLEQECNRYCADCRDKGPRWAAWNIGAFICTTCAGLHRNLGVHISRVRSVNLDMWTEDQVETMKALGGNDKVNLYYESSLPTHFKKPSNTTDLERFIRAKYERKEFVERGRMSEHSQEQDDFRKSNRKTKPVGFIDESPPHSSQFSKDLLSKNEYNSKTRSEECRVDRSWNNQRSYNKKYEDESHYNEHYFENSLRNNSNQRSNFHVRMQYGQEKDENSPEFHEKYQSYDKYQSFVENSNKNRNPENNCSKNRSSKEIHFDEFGNWNEDQINQKYIQRQQSKKKDELKFSKENSNSSNLMNDDNKNTEENDLLGLNCVSMPSKIVSNDFADFSNLETKLDGLTFNEKEIHEEKKSLKSVKDDILSLYGNTLSTAIQQKPTLPEQNYSTSINLNNYSSFNQSSATSMLCRPTYNMPNNQQNFASQNFNGLPNVLIPHQNYNHLQTNNYSNQTFQRQPANISQPNHLQQSQNGLNPVNQNNPKINQPTLDNFNWN